MSGTKLGAEDTEINKILSLFTKGLFLVEGDKHMSKPKKFLFREKNLSRVRW